MNSNDQNGSSNAEPLLNIANCVVFSLFLKFEFAQNKMGKQSHDRNRLLVLYECGIKSAKKLHQLTDTLKHNLWSSEAVSDRKSAQSWVRATAKTQREWLATRRATSKFSRKMIRHKNHPVTGTKNLEEGKKKLVRYRISFHTIIWRH
jgi:hypothetical protein